MVARFGTDTVACATGHCPRRLDLAWFRKTVFVIGSEERNTVTR